MKKKSYNGYDLLLGGLFIALALVFPIIFHAVGLGGSFMPMFYPIAAAGFLIALPVAVGVGFLSPLVSAFFTGMPPYYPPIAFVMMAEGMVIGAIIAFLYRRFKLNPWLTIIIAMIADRIVLLISMLLLTRFLQLPGLALTTASLIKGIPGIIAMIIVIPPLVKRMESKIRFIRMIE